MARGITVSRASLVAVALVAGLSIVFESHGATVAAQRSFTITVTEGEPSELGILLSRFQNLAPGTYTFKVTNRGVGTHNFEICNAPIPGLPVNSCAGKKTVPLKHGQTATLTFTFVKKGAYEFLCSIPGHAAAGMKGFIGIGMTVTPTGAATPAKSATSPVVNGCPPGVTIVTAGNDDGDDDETGAPDDGDGCL